MRIGFVVLVLGLALLVWNLVNIKSDVVSKEVVVRTIPPMTISYEKAQARHYLDSIRSTIGLNALMPNAQLESAATAHADYLMHNNLSAHMERQGLAYFTGVSPSDRATHAGYRSSYVNENLSTQNYSAKSSMDGLFAAIYHRFGFLSPDIDEIGAGIVQDPSDSDRSAFVYLMGNRQLNTLCNGKDYDAAGRYVYQVCADKTFRIKEASFLGAHDRLKRYNPKIIAYPYDGQRDVVPVFYNEDPDPLPDYKVSGFPISVEFNDYFFKSVKLLSFNLFKGEKIVKDVRLMHQHNDPNHKFKPNQYALFPLKRLEYDTTYRVELIYKAQHATETLSWQFHTQTFKEPVHTVSAKEAHIDIRANEDHVIYFRPYDASEMLMDYRFPQSVDVELIDYNTIKLHFLSQRSEPFDIVSSQRRLHVNIIE